MMIREPALKDYKGENYSHLKAGGNEDQLKYEKEKDPTVLDNYSRQKMKEF